MKKVLTRQPQPQIEIYYYKDGLRIEGIPSELTGNVSMLTGNVSGLTGDISGLRGNVLGLRGDVSRLRGDVDLSEITPEERAAGIDITLLILPEGNQLPG